MGQLAITVQQKINRAQSTDTPIAERIKLLREIVEYPRIASAMREDLRTDLANLEAEAKQLLPEPGEPDDSGFEPASDDEDQKRNSLAALLETLQVDKAQVCVKLYRVNATTKQEAFITQWTPEEFMIGGEARVSREYGGGHFMARVYGPRSDGLSFPRLYASRQFYLEGEPILPVRKPETAAAGSDSAMAMVLVKLGEMQQAGLDRIATMIAARKEPDVLEIGEKLGRLKSLFGGDAPRTDPLELFGRALDTITKMQGAMQAVPENPSDTHVALTLAREFLPLLREGLATKNAGSPAAPISLVDAGGNPIATTPAPAESAPPQAHPADEDEPMNLILRGYVLTLINEAKQNNPVEKTAELIVAQAPEDFLARFIDSPTWFEDICAIDARAKLYPMWFERLKAAVRKELTDEDRAA